VTELQATVEVFLWASVGSSVFFAAVVLFWVAAVRRRSTISTDVAMFAPPAETATSTAVTHDHAELASPDADDQQASEVVRHVYQSALRRNALVRPIDPLDDYTFSVETHRVGSWGWAYRADRDAHHGLIHHAGAVFVEDLGALVIWDKHSGTTVTRLTEEELSILHHAADAKPGVFIFAIGPDVDMPPGAHRTAPSKSRRSPGF
jgi:hypothetical protein